MDLKTYLAGHDKKEFAAKKLGIAISALYNYIEGRRLTPLDIAIKIEKLTHRKVTVEDLLKTWREKNDK